MDVEKLCRRAFERWLIEEVDKITFKRKNGKIKIKWKVKSGRTK